MSTINRPIVTHIPSEVIETVINIIEKLSVGRPIAILNQIESILKGTELSTDDPSKRTIMHVDCLDNFDHIYPKNRLKVCLSDLVYMLSKNITVGRTYDVKVAYSQVTHAKLKDVFGAEYAPLIEQLNGALSVFFKSVCRLVAANYTWVKTSDGFYVLARKRGEPQEFYYRLGENINGLRFGYKMTNLAGDGIPTPYEDKIPHMSRLEVMEGYLSLVPEVIPQCPSSQEPCGGIHDKCMSVTYTTGFPEQQVTPTQETVSTEPVAEEPKPNIVELKALKTMDDEDYDFLESLPPVKLKDGVIQVWDTVGDDPESLANKIATYLGYEITEGSPTCFTYRLNLGVEKDWKERYGETVFENGKFKIDNWIGSRLPMKFDLNLTPKEGKEVSVMDATYALIALSLLLDAHVRIIENKTTKALIGN